MNTAHKPLKELAKEKINFWNIFKRKQQPIACPDDFDKGHLPDCEYFNGGKCDCLEFYGITKYARRVLKEKPFKKGKTK